MDLRVRDKAFLVVGGTGGMGRGAARTLAEDGAAVAVVGRDATRAAEVAAELESLGSPRAVGLVADVTASGAADTVVTDAVAALGRLDGLVVTTGLLGHEPTSISDERWAQVFQDVFVSVCRLVDAALPHLVQTRGTVVTTSAYSIRAPEAARLPYSSLKAAVATYTKGVAKAYGPQGVRANCVAPGVTEGPSLTAIRAQVSKERGIPFDEALERVMIEDWHLDIALRRPGTPQEAGDLMAFLASPRSGYVTGALVNVDGGTNF